MTFKHKTSCRYSIVFLMVLVLFACGCSHSVYSVSENYLAVTETQKVDTAETTIFPYVLVITTPVDLRSDYYQEHVAGTKWTGCTSDPFWGWDVSQMLQQKLVKEFQSSGRFSKVLTSPITSNDVIMKTEIHSFCSEAVGCLFIHVAGIISLRVTLEQNGNIFFDKKFERVVTDSDIEYSGAELGFIKNAMFTALTDNLDMLLKDLLKQTDTDSTKG